MMSRQLVNWVIDDRRDRRIGELVGVLWILSLADLTFTLWAHFFTPFHEMNPIARTLLSQGLIPSLVLLKLLLTAIGATIFWRLRHAASSECALWGLNFLYVLLALRWSEYTAMC